MAVVVNQEKSVLPFVYLTFAFNKANLWRHHQWGSKTNIICL